MNFLNVYRSAGDGLRFLEPSGPVKITNSTISYNRGHGIVIQNTTDGRVFINQTRVLHNLGDGIQYSVKHNMFFYPNRMSVSSAIHTADVERPLFDMCETRDPPVQKYYPQMIEATLKNGTLLDPGTGKFRCEALMKIPGNRPYTYTIQFLEVRNRNPTHMGTRTELDFCDNGPLCSDPQYTIPVHDGAVPSSIVVQNRGSDLWIGMRHVGAPNNRLAGDIRVVMRVHAMVKDQVVYGLNVSNSLVADNLGKGIFLNQMRDRTVINNVTILRNQHLAGIHIFEGAGDVWINNTNCSYNLGDGLNVSFAGGSTLINGTSFIGNQLRGVAFHFNTSANGFIPLSQSVVIRGRRSNSAETQTIITDNQWGGIVVGNFCANHFHNVTQPKLAINFVQLERNAYHPSFEYFSCQRPDAPITKLEFTGSLCTYATGFCFRLWPAVNLKAIVSDNRFFRNQRPALLIRNKEFAHLAHLPVEIKLFRNQFKFNRGNYIVSVGLNEDAPAQIAVINGQNELKQNQVFNPYPLLNPRNNPYAAMIISSSNVEVTRNCFDNDDATYEIATDIAEHAKSVNAVKNSWGKSTPEDFMPKIFDGTKRYNLAMINVDPFAALCNWNNPFQTKIRQYIPPYHNADNPMELGGQIFESVDLRRAVYTVSDDLHILPGAKLILEPGVRLEFQDSIGMLVQGQLLRMDTGVPDPLVFTYKNRKMTSQSSGIRLVDEIVDEDFGAISGRLELYDQDQEEWGAVCNRSWTPYLAAKACHQLGMMADLEFIENWWTYPKQGSSSILWDNIWCEEMEPQIQDCRHDGLDQNVNLTCPPGNVVGLRCIQPRWAGIRYTLHASPPSTTQQEYIQNLIIERAGLMDYYTPIFSPALQIDWNYHTFKKLTVRDNFWTGIDIVYNDLVKKPKIEDCVVTGNRRHGLRSRSYGLTLDRCNISDNQNAGIRYNPILSRKLQQDVVTWIERTDISRNQVVAFPAKGLDSLVLGTESDHARKFLVSKMNPEFCVPDTPCTFEMQIASEGSTSKVGISIIDRPDLDGDENVLLIDSSGRMLDLRKDLIKFPFVSTANRVTMKYTRTHGGANIKLLAFFQDTYDYLTPFIHVGYSEISHNQYAVSTLHYSSFDHADGSLVIRYEQEQLWFQKTDFVANRQAVIWVNAPIRDAARGNPIAEIEYYVDNCSVSLNNGSIIETHKDLYQSANVFHWRVWRTNFLQNFESGIDISLPDTYDQKSKKIHEFWFTENLVRNNRGFKINIGGFYAWMNVSANNFSRNTARENGGLFRVSGMEKSLVMERNRFEMNRGNFIYLHDTSSLSPNFSTIASVPAYIRYNIFLENYLKENVKLIYHYPRSFAICIRGVQPVDVNYNDFWNEHMDFEAVVGLKGVYFNHKMNLSFNYWGRGHGAEIAQRIFDFNDWNIYSLADFNPFFMNAERPWRWEWEPRLTQTDSFRNSEPSIYDLHGMLFNSIRLPRKRERYSTFPHYFKRDVPYFITKDLTVMPGVTLTIDPGVELHIGPGVKILVLGTLKAEGTHLEPIRFKPINTTEMKTSGGQLFEERINISEAQARPRRQADPIYRQFSMLHRQDTFFQKFNSYLIGGDPKDERSGFLEIFNSTTGEMVPICDRQFTRRNAEVVCRELGFETFQNAYFWVGPRYDFNPRIRITRSYSEPRQCLGDELRLSDCNLRIVANRDMWYCSNTEHFVFIHCALPDYITKEYIAPWGGITIATYNLEQPATSEGNLPAKSSLKFVEIVGAGRSHNGTDGAAVEVMFQNLDLSHVNVTNSSMHAINIIGSSESVQLDKLNVTYNRGKGMSILSLTNLGERSGSDPLKTLTIPYNVYGAVEICSATKVIEVRERVLLYFKYDNFPVDCYKVFQSQTAGRNLGVRFIQLNLYAFDDEIGRTDTIGFYESADFSPEKVIYAINHTTRYAGQTIAAPKGSGSIAVYLRANAAEPSFGFLAEVTTLPTSPDSAREEQVVIHSSRFESNDRGGLAYASIGERNPNLVIDRCYFGRNGYHLWGNFTTSTAAVDLTLQNTLYLQLTDSMVWRNMGGVHLQAGSTTSIARLGGLIKNVAFSENGYYEALRLVGRNYQEVSVVNSYFGKNYVLYRDVVLVDKLISNFSHNTFYNNTGTHIIDVTGYTQVPTDIQGFYHNLVYDNIAYGHGYRFNESYGYLPPETWGHVAREEFRRRKKREVGSGGGIQRGPRSERATSFEWWAHVGADTPRYRSTILAGSSQQRYEYNYFVNPANDFEITTVPRTQYDAHQGPLMARRNWWGEPGTESVASGRIRDQQDYPYLVPTDYTPVLHSNSTLLDNGCPPGWFYTGQEKPTRIRSCFLFIGGGMPYHDAAQFCIDNDGFMPYFQAADPRLKQIAERLRVMIDRTTVPGRYDAFHKQSASPMIIWVAGVMVPPQQCGYLSTATAEIGYYNCEGMLPFICEKGPGVHAPYFWLSKAGIFAIVISILTILVVILILMCWFVKSRRRKREFFERKNSLRDSLRSNRLEQQKNAAHHLYAPQFTPTKDLPRPVSPDLISSAHARLVLGDSADSLAMHKGSTVSGSDGSVTTSHSMISDAVTNTSYPDYLRKKPPLSSGFVTNSTTPTDTTSESAYATQSPGLDGQGSSIYGEGARLYSSGTADRPSHRKPPRPTGPEVITLRHPPRSGTGARPPEHESRSSLSTFRQSDISENSSCSCTVTDTASLASDRPPSLSTLTYGPTGMANSMTHSTPERQSRDAADDRRSPYRPARPPPPPPKSGDFDSRYDAGPHYAYANGAASTSPSHLPHLTSPLRQQPLAKGQRPQSTNQFSEPPNAYGNMAYATSPSFDSLVIANQNSDSASPFARGQANLSSFGKSPAAGDRSQSYDRSLPLETAM